MALSYDVTSPLKVRLPSALVQSRPSMERLLTASKVRREIGFMTTEGRGREEACRDFFESGFEQSENATKLPSCESKL